MAESKQQPHVRRQQPEGHLPDDAAFRIVETVELVHHYGRSVLEIELSVQQAIEEDFGHDHEHAGRWVLAAVAGHQADVGCLESPLHGAVLHLVELLLREGDQGSRVVRLLIGVQSLEEGRLGDQRLAGARRRETSTPWSFVNQARRASSWTLYGSNGSWSR